KDAAREKGAPTPGSLRQGFELARRHKHEDRLSFLVFWRGLHLVACQLEDDAVALLGRGHEVQCGPGHGDLAAADAQKSAEVEDGGAPRARAVDQHVDDASHVLVRRAAYLAAEDA